MGQSVSLGQWLRLIWLVLVMVVLTLVLLPFQMVAVAFNLPLKRSVPQWWHKVMVPVLGLDIKIIGDMAPKRPLLLVSNHQSWLDIVVLGSVARLSFIAKSEVSNWPGFSWLAKLQRTVFVERERRTATGLAAGQISERMVEGDVMVLFAEGTTSDGNRILPFKTSLFGAAQLAEKAGGVEEVTLQTVTVGYTHIRNGAAGRAGRKALAWYGDADLLPHMLSVVGMGRLQVEVRFGETRKLTPETNRKALAKACEAEVREQFADSCGYR